jgi:ABC-type bacteriocin/lantibiotic exporter with double-glycine peptidase domain
LYRRIWKITGRSQIWLIALSIGIAVLAAVPLQFQKDIINGLAGNMEWQKLLLLGGLYLCALLLSSTMKFGLGYRSQILSEAVIRLIRNRIFLGSVHEEEVAGEKSAERGTIVTMISSEAEEVGKFVGSAIATPLMQLGILVSVIAYISSTQPFLGLFMIAVVLPQAIIVVAVQKRVNAKIGERVMVLRRATNRFTEADIKSLENVIMNDFDQIYEARRIIYLLKQSSKFALNAINGFGTVGILVFGGWLALEGRTDIGSIVAALSGMTRISQPWRELIAFYRDLSATRVKFELLRLAQPN